MRQKELTRRSNIGWPQERNLTTTVLFLNAFNLLYRNKKGERIREKGGCSGETFVQFFFFCVCKILNYDEYNRLFLMDYLLDHLTYV